MQGSDLARRREECTRDLLREHAELVAAINAMLDRVEAIDTMVFGFRAVWPDLAAGCEDGGPAPDTLDVERDAKLHENVERLTRYLTAAAHRAAVRRSRRHRHTSQP